MTAVALAADSVTVKLNAVVPLFPSARLTLLIDNVGRAATPADRQAENSDVLPAGSVAVDVTTDCPTGSAANDALKLALPLPSVTTDWKPINVCPSPNPEPSQAALAKNSTRKVVLAVLFKVPCTLPAAVAETMTG